MSLDPRQIRRAFARAAQDYEDHDALQREVGARLRERLALLQMPPSRVLDLGAGTGLGSAQLKRAYPKAEVIALDLALPMLRAARRHAGWWKPYARVCADAAALPLPDRSIDLLHSNLCIQWCERPDALFAEFQRVLRPGGLLLLSTFGPDTLHELRAAWADADGTHPHVSRFVDMHVLGDALIAAGFRDPVLDVEHFSLTYAEPRALLADLKGLGATNADTARVRGLTGKARFKRMLDAYAAHRIGGRIPSTWEVVYAHAFGAPEGQPRRAGGAEIATFAVDRLRGSRRAQKSADV